MNSLARFKSHLFLLKSPQCIIDVLDMLRRQCHQSCVASAKIHELQEQKVVGCNRLLHSQFGLVLRFWAKFE